MEKENGTLKRDGFKYVVALPEGEHFVSMIEFKDQVFVLTNLSMYQMIDECLVKMDIQMVDDDPTRPLPEFEDILVDPVLLQLNGEAVHYLFGKEIKKVVVVGKKLVNILTK